MEKNGRYRIKHRWARIISMLLIVILFSDEFLGSGNIVLASPQADVNMTEEMGIANEENSSAEDTPVDVGEIFSEDGAVEEAQVLFEIEDLRGEGSKQYRLSDGSIMAAEYGMDVHYQDEEGNWKDIDNRFLYETAAADDGMEGFATAEGAVEFKFAPDTADGEVVQATTGEYSVRFEFLTDADLNQTVITEDTGAAVISEMEEDAAELTAGAAAAGASITFIKGDLLNPEDAAVILEETANDEVAEASVLLDGTQTGEVPEIVWAQDWTEEADVSVGETLTEQASLDNVVTSVGYGNVMPGISLQYVASGSSLKEYILVNEEQEDYRYVFEMSLENLIPQMQEDGSLLLLDKETGTEIYEIPAAYMTDAAGSYSDAVEMGLSGTADGSYLLTIDADASWINAEERVFPVQIDPTLNKVVSTLTDICGGYSCAGNPDADNLNYGGMCIGYDSAGDKETITYIQMRNLPALPKDSVICGSMFNFKVREFSDIECPKLYVCLKKVTSPMTWKTGFSYNDNVQLDGIILDSRTITSGSVGSYQGWNITELVKEHYEAGNAQDSITAFGMRAYGGGSMNNSYCAKTSLQLTASSAYPVLQIFYRDTRGIEDYYTYQVQDLGYAGTGYVGDYTSQLTVAKTAASYESTIMPYSLGLVYNSAYSAGYFTKSTDIHTNDFSTMILGKGWKLTAQETVTSVEVEDLDGTETYLVYNDADGTEHYFRQSESDSSKYEDEDGLGLTIEKSSSTVYRMTDKKDNVKIFTRGYLTSVADGNGNTVHILYNGSAYPSTGVTASGSHRITSVVFAPKGGTAVTLFTLYYNANNCLIEILDITGRKYRYTYGTNNGYQLVTASRYNSADDSYVAEARYLYDSVHYGMTRVYDSVTGNGIQYTYEKSATGYRICGFHEYAATSISGSQTKGMSVKSASSDLRRTTYTDPGTDRAFGTGDDITTYYLFNSAGQTVNAGSEAIDGNLLGVTASAYEENSDTSKKNNRMTGSISSGQAGVNLLKNGGFESYSGTVADSWTNGSLSGGQTACRGTDSGTNYSGQRHYNFYNSTGSQTSQIYQSVSVVAGETYTFSAYINTQGATEFTDGGGAYLKVELPTINVVNLRRPSNLDN